MTLTQAKEAIKGIGRDELEKLIDQYDEAIIQACQDCDIPLSDFEECYAGSYSSREEFAQDLAEQLGAIEKEVRWPYTCIDWEWAAKELMYDYCESNGYYFRNI